MVTEGHTIKVNDGMLNLTNMWKACGEKENKEPWSWERHDNVAEFIGVLKSKENLSQEQVWKTKAGRYGGTFAQRWVHFFGPADGKTKVDSFTGYAAFLGQARGGTPSGLNC